MPIPYCILFERFGKKRKGVYNDTIRAVESRGARKLGVTGSPFCTVVSRRTMGTH